jgi:hypothetical protein
MRDHLHAFHEIFAPLGAPLREKPEVKPCPFAAFEAKKHELFTPGDLLRYSDNKRLAGAFLHYEEDGKAARYVQGGFDHVEYLERLEDDGLTVPVGGMSMLTTLMAYGVSAEVASEYVAMTERAK